MNDLLYALLTHGDKILFWVLTFIGGLLATFILGQIRAGKVKQIVGRALAEVGDAVLEVSKTYVESLKQASADGKLTTVEKKQAFDAALAVAKRNIGIEGLQKLARILGLDELGLDKWLGTKIEAAVAGNTPLVVTKTLKVGEIEKNTTTVDPR